MWVKRWGADYIREELGIPGCRSILRLDNEVRKKGELKSYETRYYVSSLDPTEVSASEFQDLILGHWEVENCLHLQKDKYYDEDKHVSVSGWGEAWTILTSMVVSLTYLLKRGEKTLREVHERIAADPRPIAKRLGLKK